MAISTIPSRRQMLLATAKTLEAFNLPSSLRHKLPGLTMLLRFPLLLIFIASLTTSCKTLHTLDGDYRFSDNPGYGLVVISTRINNRCIDSSLSSDAIHYHSRKGFLTHVPSGLFLLKHPWLEQDFHDPPGYFFVRPLPAGEYYLSTFTFLKHMSKRSLDIPFVVIEGKTQYLGELYVDVHSCDGFTYRVTDKWDRDQQFFQKRVPNQPIHGVEKQLLLPHQTQ